MSKIKAIRGMNDILPEKTPVWQFLEKSVRDVLAGYGYREIRTPIVEQTDLFKRSIGEVTDIVEKEMYTFADRNDESLTLRPEGTASCVRACEEHGLLYNQVQRLWYAGPMFRYERPQKGRYRQFHQIGVETFGMSGPDIDAELILLSARLWKKLGIDSVVTLEINTLGSAESRQKFKDDLVCYLTTRKDDLDPDSQRRLTSNPLRILDSKSAQTQLILNEAPNFHDYLDDESVSHFENLKILLESAGVSFRVNPRLVRGLDYYSKTVFEWVTEELGAQGTVCAGGRYDGLVEQLGGKATPAVGFAMGVERLILLIESVSKLPDALYQQADIYILPLVATLEVKQKILCLAETLRDQTNLKVMLGCGDGSLKSHLKKADSSGARLALLIGQAELENNTVQVKFLRETIDQQEISVKDLADSFLTKF